MSKHKALKLAEQLQICHAHRFVNMDTDEPTSADAMLIVGMHSLIVQMRDALESAANGMAELVLEVAYKPATPENIKKVRTAVITQQSNGPFGDVMRALNAADQYLKDNP